MESKIADILNRMNEENRKLNNLRKEYIECQKLRNSGTIRIWSNVLLKHDHFLNTMVRDTVHITLTGDIVSKIIDLLEEHYTTLGEQCKKNLEDMVEEMKQE